MKTNRKLALYLIFLCFFIGSLFFYYYFLKPFEERGNSILRMLIFAVGLGTLATLFWRAGVGKKARVVGRGTNIGCLTGLILCMIIGAVYEGQGLVGILLMFVLLYFGVLGMLFDGVSIVAKLISPGSDPERDPEGPQG